MNTQLILTAVSAFVFGGKAIFTIVSRATGTRFTYRVTKGKERGASPAPYFVSLLTGPDNTSDYSYIGCVFPSHPHVLVLTKASAAGPDAPSVKAFRWLLKCIEADRFSSIEFWHEGRCGRCGRRLTDPESIASGFGPECIHHVHA